MTLEEIQNRLPSDIVIACHNTVDNVTISGPSDSVNQFVKQLQSEGVFTKEIESYQCAFHSKYIEAVGPEFRQKLKQVSHLRR